MNNDNSDQMPNAIPIDNSTQCEPGCNCGKTGLGTKGKLVICLIVVVAAMGVLGRSYARKAGNGTVQSQPAFATSAPVLSTPASMATGETNPVWGEPLKNMASLNQVATRSNAVYLYLVEKGRGADETVNRQIEQAAVKAQTGGLKMALYTLDTGSQDYAQITSQVPAPCVLAMVKGGGIAVVSGEITETKLIQAIVAASRPSGGCCLGGGSSGCAPQASK